MCVCVVCARVVWSWDGFSTCVVAFLARFPLYAHSSLPHSSQVSRSPTAASSSLLEDMKWGRLVSHDSQTMFAGHGFMVLQRLCSVGGGAQVWLEKIIREIGPDYYFVFLPTTLSTKTHGCSPACAWAVLTVVGRPCCRVCLSWRFGRLPVGHAKYSDGLSVRMCVGGPDSSRQAFRVTPVCAWAVLAVVGRPRCNVCLSWRCFRRFVCWVVRGRS